MVRVWVVVALLVWCGPSAAQNVFSGVAHVIDGDTIDVGQTRVRLYGIDAVERDQTCRHPTRGEWACGQAVGHQLSRWIEGENVRCEATGRDRYGRVLARCAYNGRDVGEALVTSGLAFAYKTYSSLYVSQERAALKAGRGLWTSVVVRPEDYRRAGGTVAQAAPQGCNIKGNISRDGKRIFHRPGQAFYERTRVNTAKGERWFCNAAEARKAGWRGARR
ncbi:thermonuclease family protein [Roseobacteraceae bacterium S113]